MMTESEDGMTERYKVTIYDGSNSPVETSYKADVDSATEYLENALQGKLDGYWGHIVREESEGNESKRRY